MHAINVGPDLDFLSLYGGTNQGRCVIATASFKVVNFIVMVSADVSLCNNDFNIDKRINQWLQPCWDFFQLRLIILIDWHKVQRR